MQQESCHIVRGNVQFSGARECLYVNVRFADRSELQRLIDALIELRDSAGNQGDHVHLQHYDLAAGSHVGLAEVNFFRPGRGVTDVEKEMTVEAQDFLQMRRQEATRG